MLLFAATTAALSTALAIGMACGTAFATVVLTIFVYRITDRDNAEAGFAGAFHGSNGCHGFAPKDIEGV
jgi:hypothetical protein